jgi:phosphoribosyl 1,2-cyclic phosphodiesterase
MRFISIQSGSNGNCFYLETDEVRILFDAGISGIVAERRLADMGRDIRDVDAIVISHDHSDHSKSAGVFHRKYGIPLYISKNTLEAINIGKLSTVRHFCPGQTIEFGQLSVQTIPTPHDGVDGASFIISSKGKRLGIFTDLGHVFKGLDEAIASLDAILIESNYDPGMLEHGPYPEFLKRRISGDGGHISNFESAELLAKNGRNLKWACLGHLSEQNNSPQLAYSAHDGRVSCELHVASRFEVGPMLSL